MVEIELLLYQVLVRGEEQVHIRSPLPGARSGGQGAADLSVLCAPRLLGWPVRRSSVSRVIGWTIETGRGGRSFIVLRRVICPHFIRRAWCAGANCRGWQWQ
jgi:hypothetical protein